MVEVDRSGFVSQLCHLLAVRLWIGYMTSLSLSFLICKMEIIM